MTCKLAKIVDSQNSGLVAFTYLVPKGWQTTSSLNWNQQGLFVGNMTSHSADNKYSVDMLTPLNMVFSTYSGGRQTGVQLRHATDFLEYVMHLLEQRGKITNVRFVDKVNTELPLVAAQQVMANTLKTPGTQSSFYHEQGFAKVECDINGVHEVALLGTTVIADRQASDYGGGRFGSHFTSQFETYVVGPTLKIVMPEETSPTRIKEAQVAASSFRITPKFALFIAKLALERSKAALAETEREGKMRQLASEAERENRMDSFRKQMATKDANTHDFCNYLLDQQEFQAKNGDVLQAPTSYRYAYTNNAGDYLLSNSPTLGPGMNEWEQLQKSSATERLHNGD